MPELGDLFEGLVSGQERQRQLHKELADRAIQQAKMEQDAQEFSLRLREQGNREADRETDNKRQQAQLDSLNLYRGDSLDNRWANTALRQQGQNDAMTRFQTETDQRKKKLITDAAAHYQGQGYSPQDAMNFAYQQSDLLDRVMGGQQGSVLPASPDLSPQGAPSSQMQTFSALTGNSLLPAEATPKFQMQQGRADSQNAINTARLPGIRTANELKALELQYKKQLWPETIKNAKLLGDVRKQTAKNIELINKYLPDQRESQINSANAATGAALARQKTLLDELTERQHTRSLIPQGAPYYMVNGVIKENPADPLQATNIQSKRRDVLAKAHKNYSDTTRDIAKVSSALGGIRNATAKTMVALDALPEGSMEWQTKYGELQQYQQYGQRLHDSLNAMSATAAEQLKVMEDLRKRLGEDTKRKRDAANAVPNSRIPAVTSTRPGATGLAKVTPPPNLRPNNAAQKLPQMQLGKPGNQTTKKSKPDFSKMTDAELKAWRPGK